jgi:hypothetical protein
MRIKPSDLHWLAGVIEKGCSITSFRQNWSPRKQAWHYLLRVYVSSVNLDLLEKIKSITGLGVIYTVPKEQIASYHNLMPGKKSRYRDRHTLRIHGVQADQLLRMITPYLRTQKRRAEIAVALHEAVHTRRHCNDGTVHKQDVSKVDTLVQKLKKEKLR